VTAVSEAGDVLARPWIPFPSAALTLLHSLEYSGMQGFEMEVDEEITPIHQRSASWQCFQRS
jgi:hypothetical protein